MQRGAPWVGCAPEGVVQDVREGVVGHDPGAPDVVHRRPDNVADLDAAAA